MGQVMDIFSPMWDEIPNSHFGSHFFDSLVSNQHIKNGYFEIIAQVQTTFRWHLFRSELD
jgi:hypothetical protein